MAVVGVPTAVLKAQLAAAKAARAAERKAEADRLRAQRALEAAAREAARAEKLRAIAAQIVSTMKAAGATGDPGERLTARKQIKDRLKAEGLKALWSEQLLALDMAWQTVPGPPPPGRLELLALDIVYSLKPTPGVIDSTKMEIAIKLLKQRVDELRLPYGYTEILTALEKAWAALPKPKPPTGWKRVYPERITRAGAMPGELWDPDLHKYILQGPILNVRRITFTFEDGTTYTTTYREGQAYSIEYVRVLLERKRKKLVSEYRETAAYQLYRPRVPPLPGPVAWPRWKQRPEDWKEVSEEDLFTPGKIPDAMWSDKLGRYILPTMPRIVSVCSAWKGETKLLEFLWHYPGTNFPDVILDRKLGHRWEAWTHWKLERRWFRYKTQPYERSGERRFHLPVELVDLIDEEFERKKADYNARYGYTVEMPDWQDIFHYRVPVTMSAEEKLLIKTKQWNLIPEPRRSELMEERARRKIRIRRAMESPTPQVVRSIGTYSTMVDNAQDTLVTAAMLSRIAIKLFPKFGRRIAPVYGIAATGADILNVMALFTLLPFIAKSLKRGHFSWSSLNPFSKEMRSRRAAKMMQWKPTWGDVIQALQVSDSMCGFGICLGPLVGWYEDFIAGEIRDAKGQKVTWSPGAQRMRKYVRLTAATLLHMPMIAMGGETMTDDEHLAMLYATLGAIRVVSPAWIEEDSVAQEPDPTGYMIKAPQPQDPLTIDILQELGVDIEATSIWPATGKQWSSIDELTELPRPAVMDNLRALILRNNKQERGILIGGLINQISSEALSLYGGEHNVEVKDCAETRVAHNLLLSENYLPYNVTQDQVRSLAAWVHNYDQAWNETPPTDEVLRQGREMGILWRNTLPDRPVGKAAEIWPDYLELKEKYGAESLLA